jgi:hypothetical protein
VITAGEHEHWLDRLAVRRTRRQVLQSALAGVAVTMPFVRSTPASAADDPNACRKGCFYTSFRKRLRAYDRCEKTYGSSLIAGGLATGFAFFPMSAALAAGSAANLACLELADLAQKAMQYDCLQPDCPGFDPKGADGPCENCVSSGGTCCPDQKQLQGYACCTAPPGGCCKSDGCHSGTSDCGSG